MWFDSWTALGRVMVVGAGSYVLLVVLLRTTGKRTLSKLNAFDLVVTVAMGSVLSSALLSPDVTFAEAAAGFFTLVVLQYAVARLSVASRGFAGFVRSEPRLLLENGRLLEDALRRERVTRGEVLSALRSAGIARVEYAAAVVLETDGTLSVVPSGGGPPDVLEGVRR
ncbi:DUF421 domain-containing protein [Ramlibacter sp.]|uniref:DUF421 domain-containing protein n=1 Tax=Ramlibacter sp. TaxID=1917967 RepID=UPI002FCB4C87